MRCPTPHLPHLTHLTHLPSNESWLSRKQGTAGRAARTGGERWVVYREPDLLTRVRTARCGEELPVFRWLAVGPDTRQPRTRVHTYELPCHCEQRCPLPCSQACGGLAVTGPEQPHHSLAALWVLSRSCSSPVLTDRAFGPVPHLATEPLAPLRAGRGSRIPWEAPRRPRH
ncbi:hypothetical protein E2C01_065270 [Portunus trituberculatus]|uniref:Uncharacterized protein n=1 Tax=Portunus trituberculatus TaxID=210409 RepID=A0A5B7HLF9_PORTR|nr:hypothetical protein [Portunus trituberculatus]